MGSNGSGENIQHSSDPTTPAAQANNAAAVSRGSNNPSWFNVVENQETNKPDVVYQFKGFIPRITHCCIFFSSI